MGPFKMNALDELTLGLARSAMFTIQAAGLAFTAYSTVYSESCTAYSAPTAASFGGGRVI